MNHDHDHDREPEHGPDDLWGRLDAALGDDLATTDPAELVDLVTEAAEYLAPEPDDDEGEPDEEPVSALLVAVGVIAALDAGTLTTEAVEAARAALVHHGDQARAWRDESTSPADRWPWAAEVALAEHLAAVLDAAAGGDLDGARRAFRAAIDAAAVHRPEGEAA